LENPTNANVGLLARLQGTHGKNYYNPAMMLDTRRYWPLPWLSIGGVPETWDFSRVSAESPFFVTYCSVST